MILVTSATGTVGSEIVKQLKAQGLAVTAASRNPAKAQADLGVPAVAWHWDQPRSFGEALAGVHTLFLGTPPGTTEELAWGLAAVEAAKAAGVKKIVKLSAIGVENMPDSAHRKIELAIEAGGFEWFFARPSFFMQNLNEGMLQSVKAGVIALPAGDGRTGFIDARDIAAVFVEAIKGHGLDGQLDLAVGAVGHVLHADGRQLDDLLHPGRLGRLHGRQAPGQLLGGARGRAQEQGVHSAQGPGEGLGLVPMPGHGRHAQVGPGLARVPAGRGHGQALGLE